MEQYLPETETAQPNPYMKENKFLAFLYRILPSVIWLIKLVFYTIFSFIKNTISYMIDQMRNY